MKTKKRTSAGLAPWGRHSGVVPPPNENCAPPSEVCAPKKVASLMPLECSSRPETLKILVVTPEIVSKNLLFCRFCNKDLFFRGSTPEIVEIRAFFEMKTFSLFYFLVFTPKFVAICDENLRFLVLALKFGALNFLWPKKIVYAPQSRYPGAVPGLHQNSIAFFEVSVSGLGLSELKPTLPKKESRPSLPRRQHWLRELVLQTYSA